MAHVKVFTHRVMVSAALLGAGAAVMVGSAMAADWCYYFGSMVVFR